MNLQTQANNGTLTSEQLSQFEEEGYLLLRGVLPQSALDAVQGVFEKAVEEQAQEWLAAGQLTSLAR